MAAPAAAGLPAISSGLGSIIGGGLGALGSFFGAKSSAKQAKKMAREQMAFQERMSNTAYQRSADDLEAAGLNRILALGSPASTPAGASAPVPNYGDALATGAKTASEAMTQRVQRQNIQAQTSQASSAAGVNKAREKQITSQTVIQDAIAKAVSTGQAGIEELGKLLINPDSVGSTVEALKEGAEKAGSSAKSAIDISDQFWKTRNKTVTDIAEFLLDTSPAIQSWKAAKSLAQKIKDYQEGKK